MKQGYMNNIRLILNKLILSIDDINNTGEIFYLRETLTELSDIDNIPFEWKLMIKRAVDISEKVVQKKLPLTASTEVISNIIRYMGETMPETEMKKA